MAEYLQNENHMENISIFIGSSSEGLDVAEAIGVQLQAHGEVTIWKDGVFSLSLGTLENLINKLDYFDFGILVVTPDDIITSHNITSRAPRDNVMFELGLFMGRLGRDRTFIVCSDNAALKLPTDLAGISISSYRSNRQDGNLIAALNPPCAIIKKEIREHAVCKKKKNISLIKEIETQKNEIIELNNLLILNNKKIEALHSINVNLLNVIKSF